jgi:hypothetical protein
MDTDTPPVFDDSQLVLGLDAARIAYTIGKLERRIEERFPNSGLGQVCSRLKDIAENTVRRVDEVSRPILWLRTGTWIMAVTVVVGFVTLLFRVLVLDEMPGGVTNALTVFQALETGIQDVVFVGIGLVFLISAETRIKRRRALLYIRELRAVAHIVDMHQLTKDPGRLLRPAADTESSPKRSYTPTQLGRYLDYCSEMLSLNSKIAALYAERFSDGVVLQAVDEIEALTTGLSRKIWQKIMILDDARLLAESD